MKLSANLATSIKGAQLDFESKQLAYTQTVRNVELTVRKKFYELLFENENLAVILPAIVCYLIQAFFSFGLVFVMPIFMALCGFAEREMQSKKA